MKSWAPWFAERVRRKKRAIVWNTPDDIRFRWAIVTNETTGEELYRGPLDGATVDARQA